MKKEEREGSVETLAQWAIVSAQMTPIVKEKTASHCCLNGAILYYNVYFELKISSQNSTKSLTSAFYTNFKLQKAIKSYKNGNIRNF